MAEQSMPKWIGFKKLSTSLKRKGVRDPDALAAYLGRKKYGARKFNKAAAAGKSLRGSMPAYKGK
jgi:hypothetical protein